MGNGGQSPQMLLLSRRLAVSLDLSPLAVIRQAVAVARSALHMHVVGCICSNVRQFHKIIGMIHVCYHTIVCT